MALGPETTLFETPAIDDVAIEDQAVALRIFEKMIHLPDFAVVRAEVDVGDDDGFYLERFLVHRRARLAKGRQAG